VRSGQLAQGPQVRAFEEEVAARVGRRYGVAVSSGTAGLHLALRALGVGAGERVAMPSYVCSALLHATRAAGAEPVLADVDAGTRNLDADAVAALPRLRAVILPHLFGLPAEAERFEALGVELVEDCAMAIGGRRGGRPVGSFGAVSVCSFYATKVICSGGEGGMVLTDRAEVADRVRQLREYDGLPPAPLRHNYKMSELAAGIGRVQLGRLEGFVGRRQEIAAVYDRAFADLPVVLPVAVAGRVWYRYVLYRPGRADDLIGRLEGRGVQARRPVCEPLHRGLGETDADYPRTAAAWAGDVSVPIYPGLSPDEVTRVCQAVGHSLEEG
jgi:dTDP-4-amino-4,6-dideoxygalactose transaminase